MSFQPYIWQYLWIGPHVLLIGIAILMFRKGLHKDFPIFFSYLIFEFLQFCLLYTVHYYLKVPGTVSMKIDMFGRAGSIALRFGILQEMLEAPVAHSVPLRQAMARILNWATVVLVVLASALIGSLYYSILGHRVFQAYVTTEALYTAQSGLLVLVFLWPRFLGLRMSAFVFGIALGMGLAVGLDPLILALKGSLTAQNSQMVDFLQMGLYHGAVLIWLYFVLVRDKNPSNAEAVPLLDVHEYAAGLGRIANL